MGGIGSASGNRNRGRVDYCASADPITIRERTVN